MKKWTLIINLIALTITLVGLFLGYYFFFFLFIPLGFNFFNQKKQKT
jgi:Sec-independent protein secretion pathway component TatC